MGLLLANDWIACVCSTGHGILNVRVPRKLKYSTEGCLEITPQGVVKS